MSYSASVFHVMIASPDDVPHARSLVREVLAEWNAVHSVKRKIVLLPVSWELHSSPEMGGRPQAIINKQILKDCDLLIGVFWTRLGTPTGEFASGTVEEIEEHVGAGKPAMLYFSEEPVRPNSVDGKQYAALKEFQERCKERGLYSSYSDLNDFRNKLYRHIQLKINEHQVFAIERTARRSHEHTIVVPQFTTIPSLSLEARAILMEAAADPHGAILHVRSMTGTTIQSNSKSLIDGRDRRSVARWESALEELETNGLIIATTSKREVFELTKRGYEVADTLHV